MTFKQHRALCGPNGITQYDLAVRLKMSRDRLIRIEHGRAVATRAEAQALAKAFQCTVEDLGVQVQE